MEKEQKQDSYELEGESSANGATELLESNFYCPISDNPFSMRMPTKRENKIYVQKAPLRIDDNVFTKFLTKASTEVRKDKPVNHKKVYSEINIMSKHELRLSRMKYYKFPFDCCIVNDGNPLFYKLYTEYLVALKSAYNKYKMYKQEFYLINGSRVIHFGESLECSVDYKKEFEANDISFVMKDCIVVNGLDIALVFDHVINYKCSIGFVMPFVISKLEFDNSIVTYTRIDNGPVIKNENDFLYLYRISGHFIANDYECIFNENIQICEK